MRYAISGIVSRIVASANNEASCMDARYCEGPVTLAIIHNLGLVPIKNGTRRPSTTYCKLASTQDCAFRFLLAVWSVLLCYCLSLFDTSQAWLQSPSSG